MAFKSICHVADDLRTPVVACCLTDLMQDAHKKTTKRRRRDTALHLRQRFDEFLNSNLCEKNKKMTIKAVLETQIHIVIAERLILIPGYPCLSEEAEVPILMGNKGKPGCQSSSHGAPSRGHYRQTPKGIQIGLDMRGWSR